MSTLTQMSTVIYKYTCIRIHIYLTLYTTTANVHTVTVMISRVCVCVCVCVNSCVFGGEVRRSNCNAVDIVSVF